MTAQERPRRATQVQGQGQRLGGATPHQRSGALAGRTNPTPEARGGSREDQPHVQGAVAARVQEGLEELFHVQVRRGGGEEIPLVQGKEQQLRFAGAAMKRYPTSKVRETQVRGVVRGHQRADTLKP